MFCFNLAMACEFDQRSGSKYHVDLSPLIPSLPNCLVLSACESADPVYLAE